MSVDPAAGSAAAGNQTRHGSVTQERRLAAPPPRVFAAFADSSVRGRWFRIPSQPGTAYHELDFRVGGGERAGGVFPAMDAPERIEYRSWFLDIVADERIVFAYEIVLDGRRRTVSLVTVQLAPEGDGTRLTYTEQYTLLDVADGGDTDAAHLEGALRLLLNGLTAAVDRPAPAFRPAGT